MAAPVEGPEQLVEECLGRAWFEAFLRELESLLDGQGSDLGVRPDGLQAPRAGRAEQPGDAEGLQDGGKTLCLGDPASGQRALRVRSLPLVALASTGMAYDDQRGRLLRQLLVLLEQTDVVEVGQPGHRIAQAEPAELVDLAVHLIGGDVRVAEDLADPVVHLFRTTAAHGVHLGH